MTESVASRVRRLVTGTVNAIVDSVEALAPETVMEEAIREMGKAIDDVRAELGQVMARQHQATRRLATENDRHVELNEQIRQAVAARRDDLAEAGVERLLDIEAQIPVLQEAIAETRTEQAELEGYVGALQARRREMEVELKEYRSAQAAAARTTGTTTAAGTPVGTTGRAAKADEAFSRMLSNAGGYSSGGPALDAKSVAMRTELEQLARQNRVRERLAALKSEG